jgi:L-threonylcarbamoyladenylate synthase
MNPPVYSLADAKGRAAAVDALRRERVIAYPTDTLYGVGGDAMSAVAAERTVEAKGRDAAKGLPVLIADVADATALSAEWPQAAAALARQFWPGGLTLVVRAKPELPETVRSDDTVALRVPGLALLRRLIQEAGVPLIGTSANRAGEPAALTAAEAAAALAGRVELVLDGGRVAGHPSTIVRVRGAEAEILRVGAVSRDALEAALLSAGARLAPAQPA